MGWTWDVSGRVKMTPFGYLWHNILICMSLSFCISCFQFRSSFCLILPAALYFFILATWVAVLVIQSCLTLCNPMDYIAHQAPQSMEFSRQEYWNGLPLPSPGDLSNPRIKHRSPALQADSLPPLGKSYGPINYEQETTQGIHNHRRESNSKNIRCSNSLE